MNNHNITETTDSNEATLTFRTFPVPFIQIPIKIPFTQIGLRQKDDARDNRYDFAVPEIAQQTITPKTLSSGDCMKLAGFQSLPRGASR